MAEASPYDSMEDGFFNYQQIMDNFMDLDGSDSELAESTKLGFMANMVQSAFSQQLAKQMAQYQTSLGQSNIEPRCRFRAAQ